MSLDALYQRLANEAGTAGTAPVPPPVQPQTRMVEPSGPLGPLGPHKKTMPESESPGPLSDIDTIINVLVDQVGRNLGTELECRIRNAMEPMSRKDRAELAAALDDAFAVAPNVGAARWQCHRLLSDAKALAEAKAVWPGYPAS